MQINFKKNIQFTRHVKTNNRVREFNFRKIQGPTEDLFHVDVNDDRGNRLIFKMQKTDNQWKILNVGLPPWVYDSEKQLHDSIEEELQK